MGPRRRRRRGRALLAAVVLLAVVAIGVVVLRPRAAAPAEGCTVTAGGKSVALELPQAANAATIAAVGQRRGMPDHAVTVALVTALQESKLRNLDYGDRDSLGLFQQRPSQGWGTPEQLVDPVYASGEFYAHLVKVPGWQTAPVEDAAQAVQRSADGSAYADWEPTARILATALTGEVPHGVACVVRTAAPAPGKLAAALAAERGAGAVGTTVPTPAGWATASWLVASAAQYGIASVTFAGQTWTHSTGRWQPGGSSAAVVTYALFPAR